MAPGAVAEIPCAREIVPTVNRISAALGDAGGLVVYTQNTLDEVAIRTWATSNDEGHNATLSAMAHTSCDVIDATALISLIQQGHVVPEAPEAALA
jgi:hypothetical protein